MNLEKLIGNLLQNITEDALLLHLSKAYPHEIWAWEFLLNAIEIEKNADFLHLEENLTENHRSVSADYKKNQPYEDFILNIILETLAEEGVSAQFKVSLIKEALRLGLYPMSVNLWNTDFLTFRHHLTKTIITFDRLHIPKKTARYIRNDFANYTMTFNRDFRRCVQAINDTYKDTWLCPKLIKAFEEINQHPTRYVSVDSVEIWNAKGELVAGEIGFITGNTYASLSGFHKEKNIGTVQMSLLGLYLKHNGFAYWDLGMSLPYKYRYGAINCDRQQQAALWNGRKKCRKVFPKDSFSLEAILKQEKSLV